MILLPRRIACFGPTGELTIFNVDHRKIESKIRFAKNEELFDISDKICEMGDHKTLISFYKRSKQLNTPPVHNILVVDQAFTPPLITTVSFPQKNDDSYYYSSFSKFNEKINLLLVRDEKDSNTTIIDFSFKKPSFVDLSNLSNLDTSSFIELKINGSIDYDNFYHLLPREKTETDRTIIRSSFYDGCSISLNKSKELFLVFRTFTFNYTGGRGGKNQNKCHQTFLDLVLLTKLKDKTNTVNVKRVDVFPFVKKDDGKKFYIDCPLELSFNQILFIGEKTSHSFFLLTLENYGNNLSNLDNFIIDVKQLEIDHKNVKSKTDKKLKNNNFFDNARKIVLLTHTKSDILEGEEIIFKFTNFPLDLVRLIILYLKN
jgi:hypothetical protein